MFVADLSVEAFYVVSNTKPDYFDLIRSLDALLHSHAGCEVKKLCNPNS